MLLRLNNTLDKTLADIEDLKSPTVDNDSYPVFFT